MRGKRWSAGVFFLVAIFLSSLAWAQGPHFQGPRLFGSWEPKVGSGAAYRIESKSGQPMDWEWAIVGTEKVGADTGYWLEMYGRERRGETVVMKQLVVWRAGEADVRRIIVQSDDQPPMELPMMMMGRQHAEAQKDVRQTGRRIGTESVTTPAGTFVCEHWQGSDSQGTHDVWLSRDVAPYGLVKSTSPDSTVILTRVITKAQSRVKGQPRSMEEMMREKHRQE